MTLTHAIQVEAHRLGFDLVGVTTPFPPPHYQKFEEWLSAGYHAGMAYLEKMSSRVRRANPLEILPDCRRILVLGIRYPPSPGTMTEFYDPTSGLVEDVKSSPYRGRVASYAWSEDYHQDIPTRLNDLVAFIETEMGKTVPHACYTDSGHILERDLAQRAGLGWIGKNTNLINPQMGSYFLLAEILLGIELEISAPFEQDRCGTCTRCLEACPTGCILPDRTLDASRCISYLTIENKGNIPVELRSKMGEWVFGCDICQQVCPWNRRLTAPAGAEAYAPPGIAHPDLTQALSLTPEDFSRQFRGSPVKRTKRTGYLRNVAVALGNQLVAFPDHKQRPLAVAALRETLIHDSQPLIRAHAAWALGRAGEVQILQTACRLERDPSVLNEIQIARDQ
ncbi:MAG: tRNA epoxyqueuosine(34) reductase QueG [Anaerolineales bacterium]|nr:tRNA epoxyqueuosine(34) reductase QueG [Anaerolineales bacterium]